MNYLGDVPSVGSLAAPSESTCTLALFQCVEIAATWIEVFEGLHLRCAACSVYSWHTCRLSRCALVSLDGVVPSRMVSVSASVNLPLHHKVQKFSSGTGSPGWSRKKGRKTVVVVVVVVVDSGVTSVKLPLRCCCQCPTTM